jgi:hypothetical protein
VAALPALVSDRKAVTAAVIDTRDAFFMDFVIGWTCPGSLSELWITGRIVESISRFGGDEMSRPTTEESLTESVPIETCQSIKIVTNDDTDDPS